MKGDNVKNESLCENNEPQEALENNSVTEVDPDDPPVLPDVQKLPSEGIDIGDINTGPIRPKHIQKLFLANKTEDFNLHCLMVFLGLNTVFKGMLYFAIHVEFLELGGQKILLLPKGLEIGNSGSISKTSKFNSKSKLEIHATTKQHLINSEKWASYTQNIKSGSIHTQMASAYREKVLKNRAYIKNLIDKACVLLSKCNEEFSTIFNEKTNYTSWSIQNDLINISGQMINNTIVNELIESGFFSVMCDEARCFRQEQMSVCVRYTKNLKVYERFLGFIDVSENQNADALATAMVTQAYDGANVMSGKFNGVQQKIKSKYPYAVYTHCMAHRINLIVLDMCKLVKDTRIVFNCLETLYVYFSHPANDAKFTEIQVKLGIKKTSLTRLSDTRWNCRVRNCVAVKLNFKAIVTLLNDEINSSINKDVVQAIATKKYATLGNAVTLIEGVIKTFESLRTEVGFHNIWEKIINFTKINNIIPDFPGPNSKTSKRQRQSTSNLEDFHVFATTSSEQQNQNKFNQYTENYWRTHFYQIIDTLIIHFNKRFSSNSLELATSIDYFHKMNYYESQCFIEYFYIDLLNVDVNTLQSEMLVVKNCVSLRNPSFTLEDIKLIMDAEFYPNLYKLLSLSLTIPISSATCERSFSPMRNIKIGFERL
ncbi:hypothetical protein AGLY_016835 [Aphis glycines]|uniref:HAT C-terminal dimerisation domain-containing protein n=1 Tax=Aphis glycines TaxID=307491 RepID=A0A6G0SXW0_APHGL|nr:hypothetical protein AGLY_016835 [Aphis glycines]